MHPLDNPAWSALSGPQRAFAVSDGSVARFDPQVSPFGAFAHDPGPDDWRAMADLIGPGAVVITTACTGTPPAPWTVEYDGGAVQMTGEHADLGDRATDDHVVPVPLGADDVDQMLDLVARTRPGPFAPRTWELGGYVGVRAGGTLVAMAGERMRPDGWAEISAVATDPAHRGRGLGSLLVRTVARGIVARGEVPMLHAAADNTSAIRLYDAMGFTLRRRTRFVAARAPGAPPPGDPTLTLPPHH